MTGPQVETEEQEGPETGVDVGAMVEASASEHFTTQTLETLAAKGADITVADLRALPGAEKMTDEELEAAWMSVQPGNVTLPPAKVEAPKRSWKAYNGEAEVADFSKMSAEDFLKLQYGYSANGKEHRKTLDEVFRNASNGHYNYERTQQLMAERNTALEKWRTYEQQVTEAGKERQVWEGALHAASQGNFQPLEKMLEAYVGALGAQAPTASGPAMIPAAQVQAERQGQQVYTTVVVPKAAELAAQYGVPQSEVADAIMALVGAEPSEFLTAERFAQIVDVELPAHIEEYMRGKDAQAPAADTRDAEIAKLQAELAALRTSQTSQHNRQVTEVHKRMKSAPPAAVALPAGNAGTPMPNFDSASSAREWLQNYKG